MNNILILAIEWDGLSVKMSLFQLSTYSFNEFGIIDTRRKKPIDVQSTTSDNILSYCNVQYFAYICALNIHKTMFYILSFQIALQKRNMQRNR